VTAHARVQWVEALVREHCFGGPANDPGAPLTFGGELELLALDRATHAITRIAGSPNRPSSLDVVRDVSQRLAWTETVSDKGIPRFVSGGGGALTFEPGGQLEYASAVHPSADLLLHELDMVESQLRECAERRGIMLVSRGVDPFNGPDDAPLQLTADRYSRMARYFATIGADGARMMRQTASLQLNVGGIPVLDRWPVANALAPWLVALFANSGQYAGVDTGCASYRAETWRGVDPGRTGLFSGDDAIREYSEFALAARAFLVHDSAPAFGTLDERHITETAFRTHLTTLFPEVRPRGYLELRSLDAIDADHRIAAVALVAGVLGDSRASQEVRTLLGPPDAELLRAGGREGLRNPRIAALASDLIEIALAGCVRLGSTVISIETREQARVTLSRLMS
jgi:glutamate--cysteine ligase